MLTEDRATSVKFPVSTILTVLATILLVRILELIAPVLMPLFLAILIAVSLAPPVLWLEKKRISRGVAITGITIVLILSIGFFLSVVGPKIYQELTNFIANIPQYRDDLLQKLGPENPLRGIVETSLKKNEIVPKEIATQQILGAGNMILGGVAEIVLIFVFSIYLLIDGARVIEWISAFFAPKTQHKIQRTSHELAKIVSAYVVGQFITSAMAFLFILISMTLLKVPNALLLATLAGILDVLPVLGFVLSVIPALLFALGVSIDTCLITFALYVIYHGIENYLILPKVYGNRLRISSFVVFFSLIASGLLAGIEGAIAILPVVASYPIIERVWLRRFVRKSAIDNHAREATELQETERGIVKEPMIPQT